MITLGSKPQRHRGQTPWIEADGRLVRHFALYPYVRPSELNLMAKITGFRTGTGGQAGTGALHLRQPRPVRSVRETAVALATQICQICLATRPAGGR